jgi:hypothetical protein
MIHLLFNSGNLTFENAIYQILGFQPVGPDAIHLFIENENNSITIFLQFETTIVNELPCADFAGLLSAIGNPDIIEVEMF